jgi:hypothetical protein
MRFNYRILKGIFIHGAFVPEYPVADSKFMVHTPELCVAVAKFLASRKETIESFGWLKKCYTFPDDGQRAMLTASIQPLIDMTLIQEAYNGQYLYHLNLEGDDIPEDPVIRATLGALKPKVTIIGAGFQRLVRGNLREKIIFLRVLVAKHSEDEAMLLNLFELALLVSMPANFLADNFAGRFCNVKMYPFRAIKMYEQAGPTLMMRVGLFPVLMKVIPARCAPYELLRPSQLPSVYCRRIMHMRRNDTLHISDTLLAEMTLQQLQMVLENAFADFGPTHLSPRVTSNGSILFDDGSCAPAAWLALLYTNLALVEDWLFHGKRILANDIYFARWRIFLSCIPHLLAHGYRFNLPWTPKKTPIMSSCYYLRSLKVGEGISKMWSAKMFTEKLVKYCKKLNLAPFTLDHLRLLITVEH